MTLRGWWYILLCQADVIALIWFAALVFGHSADILCGQLALSLLVLRLPLAVMLGVQVSRELHRQDARLPLTATVQGRPRDGGRSLRCSLVLLLLPLNWELTQLLPWARTAYDGLPTGALMAGCAAFSLTSGMSAMLLQLWFGAVVLPETGKDMTSFGGVLLVCLCMSALPAIWLGLRRAILLYTDPLPAAALARRAKQAPSAADEEMQCSAESGDEEGDEEGSQTLR